MFMLKCNLSFNKLYSKHCCLPSGVVQGLVTGIRGLCNGIGPAMYGLIFYVFHVNLNDADIVNVLPTGTPLLKTTTPAADLPKNKFRVVRYTFLYMLFLWCR